MSQPLTGIVTDTRAAKTDPAKIRQFAEEIGAVYVPRGIDSLDTLKEKYEPDWIVVWEPDGPVLLQGDQRFFYHPSMAKNRIAGLRKNQPDLMLHAMDLQPGDLILDCTLGLGSDALVASYAAGADGGVTGIESSPVIAGIFRWGSRIYKKGPGWLKEPLERIQVINGNHKDILRELPDNSFDIIYFDPMFRQPIHASAAISPMRGLTNPDRLDLETIQAARRAARRRIVVKERKDSSEFARLGIADILQGTQSLVAYGFIELK